MPRLDELQSQILGELGREFVPAGTLNAIGKPLYQSALAEIGESAAQALQRSNNVLNARGLIGSGIELSNRLELEKLRAQREGQALRDAISSQNQLGLSEFQSGREARLRSLLGLLDAAQRAELQTAQQQFQERLAGLDAQTRQTLADRELQARNEFARLQAQLQREEAMRREALEQALREQQARSLAAILDLQRQQQASAANAAGFAGAQIGGLGGGFGGQDSEFGGLRADPLGAMRAKEAAEQAARTKFYEEQYGNRPAQTAAAIGGLGASLGALLAAPQPFSFTPPTTFGAAAPQAAPGAAPAASLAFGDAIRYGNVAAPASPTSRPGVQSITSANFTPQAPRAPSTFLFGPSAPNATPYTPLPLQFGYVSAPGSTPNRNPYSGFLF